MYRQRSEVSKWLWGILFLALLGGFWWFNQRGESDSAWVTLEPTVTPSHAPDKVQDTSQSQQSGEVSEVRKIAVHAAGAVVKPGVYYLAQDARVVDLVQAAGGVTGSADLNLINLAESLSDGAKVMIPYRESGGVVQGGVISGGAGGSGSYISSGSAVVDGGSSSGGGSARSGKVNINTASLEELTNLPGIGTSKAMAIVQYRQEHGRFRTVDDLVKVNGIGEKTYQKLKDMIQI